MEVAADGSSDGRSTVRSGAKENRTPDLFHAMPIIGGPRRVETALFVRFCPAMFACVRTIDPL